MKAIKFLTIALALTAMQTVQAADNLNGKDNGTTNIDNTPKDEYYKVGDVDGDGKVTNKDVIFLEHYYNGWEGAENDIINDLAADIDNDGRITNKDVTYLRHYYNGWGDSDIYFANDRVMPKLP